jgi:Na+/melibiose symporter-like transporter
MNLSRRSWWRIVLGCAILLVILTFTPLVTPIGRHEPALAGMPYTLWVGIVVTIGLVALTYAATLCYPFDQQPEREDR